MSCLRCVVALCLCVVQMWLCALWVIHGVMVYSVCLLMGDLLCDGGWCVLFVFCCVSVSLVC